MESRRSAPCLMLQLKSALVFQSTLAGTRVGSCSSGFFIVILWPGWAAIIKFLQNVFIPITCNCSSKSLTSMFCLRDLGTSLYDVQLLLKRDFHKQKILSFLLDQNKIWESSIISYFSIPQFFQAFVRATAFMDCRIPTKKPLLHQISSAF